MSQRTLNATFMINGIPLVTIPVAVHNSHYICSHLYGFIVFKGCHHQPLFLVCLLTPHDGSWWSFTSHQKKTKKDSKELFTFSQIFFWWSVHFGVFFLLVGGIDVFQVSFQERLRSRICELYTSCPWLLSIPWPFSCKLMCRYSFYDDWLLHPSSPLSFFSINNILLLKGSLNFHGTH